MVQCSSPLHRWIIWRLSLSLQYLATPKKLEKQNPPKAVAHDSYDFLFHLFGDDSCHPWTFNAYGGTSAVTSQMLRHLRFQAEVMVQAVANQWMVYGYFDTAELMFSRKWNQQILVSLVRDILKNSTGSFQFQTPPTMEVVGELSLQPVRGQTWHGGWWTWEGTLSLATPKKKTLLVPPPLVSTYFPRFPELRGRCLKRNPGAWAGPPPVRVPAVVARWLSWQGVAPRPGNSNMDGGWILTGRTSGHQQNLDLTF